MYKTALTRCLWATIIAGGLSGLVNAQSPADPLSVKAIAEVETRSTDAGHVTSQLVPARRVVSGDHVIYTLEAHNVGAVALAMPVITHPIPTHMVYVADSAVGPGTEVSYSIDGGRTFDKAENLKVDLPNGATRVALAADYTHIRWQLRTRLKAGSTAFVHFRTMVK